MANIEKDKDLNNNEESKVMVKEHILATIKTNKGDIELELYKKAAPITVDKFIKLIQENFYNNIKFH